jgi:hypothetical protein
LEDGQTIIDDDIRDSNLGSYFVKDSSDGFGVAEVAFGGHVCNGRYLVTWISRYGDCFEAFGREVFDDVEPDIGPCSKYEDYVF